MLKRCFGLCLVAAVGSSASISAQSPAAAKPAAGVRTGSTVSAPAGRNGFTTIQGTALNSTNNILPNARVRLRDARTGQIVQTQATSKEGLFAFERVDPGSYIVELLGDDQTVLATSEML